MSKQGNGTAIQRVDGRQLAANAKTLQAFFDQDKVQGTLATFAEGFMKPEAMTRLALMAMNRSPILAKCSMNSILRSLMDAAALRIKPGGLNGRGYLVPRKNKGNWECHFDPGYRGLIDIARRSGKVKGFSAEVIREGDDFEWYYDPLPKLRFKPGPSSQRGEIVGAFAVAELLDGAIQIAVLDRDEIDKVKKTSASAGTSSSPWTNWEEEMCRKTAAKRLCKYLPVEDEDLDNAMALSDSADTGERVVIDVPIEEISGDESDSDSQSQNIQGRLAAGDIDPDEAEREAIEAAS